MHVSREYFEKSAQQNRWDEFSPEQRLRALGRAKLYERFADYTWNEMAPSVTTVLGPHVDAVFAHDYPGAPMDPDVTELAQLTDVNDAAEGIEKDEERKAELGSRWNTLSHEARKKALVDMRLLKSVGCSWWDAIATAPLGLLPTHARAAIERWLTNLVPANKE